MIRFLLITGILIFANGSWAVPVTFKWQAVSFNSTLPGLANGDPIIVHVFADNGGTGLLNQTWNNADISRGTLTAGSYRATYYPPTNFGDPVFETSATGQVSSSRLIFSSPPNPLNFDTQGGASSIFMARNLANTSAGNTVFWETGSDTFNASQWSVAAIPVPTAVWLFCSGLLGLIGAGRRKQARQS